MPTTQQVRALLAEGLDYRGAAERLGIAPGLAYLIATGFPADGSDAPSPEERRARGLLPASQNLSNPPVESPAAREVVRRWLHDRVAADDRMRGR
ncbi:hypothetical protein [Saccharomonospora xinjiangensis]|uniref:Uncharacterized protein n=1 Tax=Saccharomonospora xinjiangensis XJ-54 TaxID=882086 RepID=I0UX17_9PSEU|nr:hypothetical protein [Saccharomonospora xinjiangensis]EID52420.1 hypothetical protein SacxiDRAFT_0137 [Saccharomonospora xinjiangensis XJ-54]